MTTREKAQKLLDETPEEELDTFVEILASRGTSGAEPDDAVDDWGDETSAPRPTRRPET